MESWSLRPEACLIEGLWVTGLEMIDVRNPANDRVVGRVPNLGAGHARAAIDAAERALPAWRARTAANRAEILTRFHGLILKHLDELAAILTAEQGKPLAEAAGEIRYAASFVQWFAEEGKRAYGEVIPATDTGRRLIVLKQPIGVVGAITPWNLNLQVIPNIPLVFSNPCQVRQKVCVSPVRLAHSTVVNNR